MTWSVIISVPAAIFLYALHLSAALNYTTIDVPGAYSTYATAINTAGNVVGYSDNGPANSTSTTSQGFLRSGSLNPVTINVSGAISTRLWAISDAGVLYGSYIDSNNAVHLFSYNSGFGSGSIVPSSSVLLSFPSGATGPTITAMNVAGLAVGYYSTAFGVVAFQSALNGQSTPSTLTYPYQTGAQVYPRGVNASGQIILTIQYGLNTGQFLYSGRQFTAFPSALLSVAGIGAQGQVLGTVYDGSGLQHGAAYGSGAFTTYSAPGALLDSAFGAYTTPSAINTAGQVAGSYYDIAVKVHGFVTSRPTSAADSSRIAVDVPQPQTRVSGTVSLRGWAVSAQSPIVSVAVQGDGNFLGYAVYGARRDDVCQAFPSQQAGCPNVGWQYFLNTALLADGSHTLQIVATTASGSHIATAVPFVVSNVSVPSDPLFLNIDSPAPNNVVQQTSSFGGWAFDINSPIASLQVYIDVNTSILAAGFAGFPATLGGNRADVCSALGGLPNCLASGWSSSVDTTRLSNGVHTATFICTAVNGDRKSVTRSFTVRNTNTSITAAIDPSSAGAPMSGTQSISGWAVETRLPISTIQLLIDGSPSPATPTAIYYGGYRPDVCRSLPASINCPNVGWSAPLDTTQLANGQHTVQAIVTSQFDGSSVDTVTTEPMLFLVNNVIPSGTTLLNIDQPNAAIGQIFSATANLSGWAIDNVQPITSIFISIDGAQVGATVPRGVRNDVCTVFPSRPGCPTVGWFYPIDTNVFGSGLHVLTITAQTGIGSRATNSVPFAIRNTDGPLSTVIDIDSPSSASGVLSGSTLFYGWVINEDRSIGQLNSFIDGAPYLPATIGGARPDICQVYPTFPNCESSGWSLPIDTTLLANGVHNLTLRASVTNSLLSYSQDASASAYFTVGNSTAISPFLSNFDVPNSNTAYSGVLTFVGWSLRKTLLISSVTLAVDGVLFGTPSYGGSGNVRPDVCAAFNAKSITDVSATDQSYVCPVDKGVGWNFLVDTTLLSNGRHTVSLTATAIDGTHQTISAPFTVTN